MSDLTLNSHPCCDNCHWYDRFTGVCCNALSLYCADFTDWDYVCCEYEPRRYIRLGKDDFNMSETQKYRVCEVVGVDLEKEFWFEMFNGSSSCPVKLRLHLYGEGERGTGYVSLQFRNGSAWEEISNYYSSTLFTDIINHPERITRKRVWTERDIEDAKAVKRLFSWAFTVKRSDVNNEVTIEGEYMDACCTTTSRCIVSLGRVSFPSVKPGESVKLTEILEGEVG